MTTPKTLGIREMYMLAALFEVWVTDGALDVPDEELVGDETVVGADGADREIGGTLAENVDEVLGEVKLVDCEVPDGPDPEADSDPEVVLLVDADDDDVPDELEEEPNREDKGLCSILN